MVPRCDGENPLPLVNHRQTFVDSGTDLPHEIRATPPRGCLATLDGYATGLGETSGQLYQSDFEQRR